MYLEEIKMQLVQIPITKPKHNFLLNERKATTELKNYSKNKRQESELWHYRSHYEQTR